MFAIRYDNSGKLSKGRKFMKTVSLITSEFETFLGANGTVNVFIYTGKSLLAEYALAMFT